MSSLDPSSRDCVSWLILGSRTWSCCSRNFVCNWGALVFVLFSQKLGWEKLYRVKVCGDGVVF